MWLKSLEETEPTLPSRTRAYIYKYIHTLPKKLPWLITGDINIMRSNPSVIFNKEKTKNKRLIKLYI